MLPIYVVNTDMLLLISWLVNCSVVTLVQTVRCDIGHGKEPLRGFKGNYLYHYVAVKDYSPGSIHMDRREQYEYCEIGGQCT